MKKQQQQQSRETKSFNLNFRKPGWKPAVRWYSVLATLALALAVVMLACHAHGDMIFNTFNEAYVYNDPPADPVFEITHRTLVTNIVTYHWNYGSGRIAEAIGGTVGLRCVVGGVDGELVGSWPAVTSPGQNGVPSFWTVLPNVVLPAGSYKVVDSDHATWSYNAFNGQVGFVQVAGQAHPFITVTNLDDNGPGSLRQAIADAAPGDTIDFAVTGTITLTNGELAITNNLSISGPGATNLTVSGNSSSRVFDIGTNGTVTMPDLIVTISGLTIANGRAYDGGGIRNVGNLTIVSCTISNADSGYGTSFGYGGGIASVGILLVANCTIMNCTSFAGGGVCDYVGSGTWVPVPDSRITILNSTFSGNSAGQGTAINDFQSPAAIVNSTFSGNYGGGAGAAIVNQSSMLISNCTVFGNTSEHYGAGIATPFFSSGTITIRNSIVAGNTVGGANRDVESFGGTVVSQDFNLIQSTNGSTFTGVTTHNIYGKDPLLGPLADNGGPTMTHALLPGSPAIDHGSSGGLTTDQRSLPRIFNFPAYIDADDGSDIGAYELQERAQTGPVFIVNSNDDVDDGVPGIAHCSLREAINASNATPGTNTISFAAAIPGLMSGVTGTIMLANGQLTVTNSVNINGPGAANLIVSGNDASRVFSVSRVLDATISGLTIANGYSGSGYGAGIFNYYSTLAVSNCAVTRNVAWTEGGGIFNQAGVLTILRSTISSNLTSGIPSAGGGLNNWGTLSVISSAIFANSSADGGGGIENVGMLSLTNSTVSGNSAYYRGATGGGIDSQGINIIVSSTICSNLARDSGGIYLFNGQLEIQNSIVAGNSPSDCSTAPDSCISSLDYNLIQNTNGCTITNLTTHNIYNQDPKLGPLADLGGPTPTHALRFDSPAIDAGNSGGLTTDQRGLPRPIDSPDIANTEGGDGSDIGAYEADSNLRISGFGMAGADVWLSFNSMWGRAYRVESTDTLPPSWNVLTNGVIGTGGRFQTLDGGAASLPQRFYRTVLLPSP